VSEIVNSLVCQPWRDICWRAVPLVGNKYLVDEVGAKVNASACKACVGERWGRTPFCGEGRNIRGNNGWGGSTSGGRRCHAGRGRGRGGLRGVFETAPHERVECWGIRSKSRGRARSKREVNSGTKSRAKKKKCDRGGAHRPTARPLRSNQGSNKAFRQQLETGVPGYNTVPVQHSHFSLFIDTERKGSADLAKSPPTRLSTRKNFFTRWHFIPSHPNRNFPSTLPTRLNAMSA